MVHQQNAVRGGVDTQAAQVQRKHPAAGTFELGAQPNTCGAGKEIGGPAVGGAGIATPPAKEIGVGKIGDGTIAVIPRPAGGGVIVKDGVGTGIGAKGGHLVVKPIAIVAAILGAGGHHEAIGHIIGGIGSHLDVVNGFYRAGANFQVVDAQRGNHGHGIGGVADVILNDRQIGRRNMVLDGAGGGGVGSQEQQAQEQQAHGMRQAPAPGGIISPRGFVQNQGPRGIRIHLGNGWDVGVLF